MTNSFYVFLIPLSRYIGVRLTDKNVIYTSQKSGDIKIAKARAWEGQD